MRSKKVFDLCLVATELVTTLQCTNATRPSRERSSHHNAADTSSHAKNQGHRDPGTVALVDATSLAASVISAVASRISRAATPGSSSLPCT